MELLETAGPVETFAEPATDHVSVLAAVPPPPPNHPTCPASSWARWPAGTRGPSARRLPQRARRDIAAALTTVALQADDAGREVALLFVQGDPLRPLIVGLLETPPWHRPRRNPWLPWTASALSSAQTGNRAALRPGESDADARR